MAWDFIVTFQKRKPYSLLGFGIQWFKAFMSIQILIVMWSWGDIVVIQQNHWIGYPHPCSVVIIVKQRESERLEIWSWVQELRSISKLSVYMCCFWLKFAACNWSGNVILQKVSQNSLYFCNSAELQLAEALEQNLS